MSGGALINILILIILTPFVTRIFDKETFGVFYIFMSVVNISTLLSSGMYPNAFVVPKLKREFLALLKLSLILILIFTAVFTVFLFFFSTFFLELLSGERIGSYYVLLPLAVFIASIYTVFQNWNVRKKQFKKNAASNVVAGGSERGGQILMGLSIGGIFPVLIWARILSDFLKTLFLYSRSMIKDMFLLSRIKLDEVKATGREYVKYPKHILTGNFINRFSADIPLYLLAGYFGEGAVGAFGFATRMMNIPYRVMGGSIAPVYFQKANELFHKNIEELKVFTSKSYNHLLILGSLAFGFVFGFGDLCFNLVFGEEWNLAGRMARILSIYFVFKMISSPFSNIFRVVRKEEYSVYVNLIISASRILGIALGLYFNDVILAIVCFSLGNALGYFITNILVFYVIPMKYSKLMTITIIKVLLIFGGFFLLRQGFELL